MADHLILLTRDGSSRAQGIFEEFAERTGLRPEVIDDGLRFPLRGEDHALRVVETLDEIDSDWPQHVALGQPDAAA